MTDEIARGRALLASSKAALEASRNRRERELVLSRDEWERNGPQFSRETQAMRDRDLAEEMKRRVADTPDLMTLGSMPVPACLKRGSQRPRPSA